MGTRSTSLLSLLAVACLVSCHPHPPPTPPVLPPPPPTPLVGFVDMHTHPMANLGFSGKLLYGGVDWADGGAALLPSDPSCQIDQRATSLEQALGHDRSTHGGWDLFSNSCGDSIRGLVIPVLQSLNNANNPSSDATGAPAFPDWPKWNDVSHQVMWSESIRRAHQAGLRVMVALAVNNKTLADIVGGLGDGPDDDKRSADLQIAELKAFVGRHSDFMEVASSPDDLQRIVAAGHLAVVLGLEVDNLGDFNAGPAPDHDAIRTEIARLRAEGVRYLFPIHLLDNTFGTTAANGDIFDLSNLREAGHFWNLQCAAPADGITYRLTLKNPLLQPFADVQSFEMAVLMVTKLHLFSLDDPSPPPCPLDGGVVNIGAVTPGLTADGDFAVREMMRQGMLLDVDHMSQASANDLLTLATAEGYPINSGHNNVRSPTGGQTERQLTAAQYAMIGNLHGLAGIGSSRVNHVGWISESQSVLAALGDGGVVGFGTDSNGVSALMAPPPATAPRVVYSAAYPMSTLGDAGWDYNDAGVAHYGMVSDFLQGLQQVDGGPQLLDNMMHGAQAFHDMWARADAYRVAHPAPVPLMSTASTRPGAPAAPEACPAGTAHEPGCDRCLRPRENCPACDGDGGTRCVRPTRCPEGRSLDAWGLCASKATLDSQRPPLRPQLKLAAPAGLAAAMPSGKLVLSLTEASSAPTPEGAKPKPFAVELVSGPKGWSLDGKKAKAGVNVGFVGGLWVLEWVVDNQLLMLVARPEAGKPLAGGYALHRPGAPTVTGNFSLQAAGAAALKEARPLDGLPAFLRTMR